MRDFVYARPETLDQALALMRGGNGRALAGGTDLIPHMRERRVEAGTVVDLKGIPELMAISPLPDDGVAIGAAASADIIARHPAIARDYPALARSARLIGSAQIQSRASLGGNICNAAPSADAVPALICHGARAQIADATGRREIALEQLFTGPGRTVLGPTALLVAVLLPAAPPRSAAEYLRFTPRQEMDIAVAGAGTLIGLDREGAIVAARIVLAAVAPTPMRACAAELALLGERPTPALLRDAADRAAGEAQPISDTRASADYRRALIRVLTARALAACCTGLARQG